MWWLTHQRERAMWWYNRVLMPLGLRFKRELVIGDGIQDTKDVDELLLVCRKGHVDSRVGARGRRSGCVLGDVCVCSR